MPTRSRASLHDAKSGISFSEDFAEHGFRCQVWGAPTLDPHRHDRPPRHALPVARAARGTMSPWSRRSPMPASRTATSPTSAPASSWARAARRRAPSSRPPTSPARTTAPSASARSPCRRRCRRPHRRRLPPGSRSTASTIRSRRPARPRRIASATPTKSSSGASRTSSSPAATRISTGRCRTCSTRWARCRRSSTTGAAVASRAYDVDRDGFVIAGGAGVLVLEELEHAKARGAKIYAEIVGYGATSDGYDMVAPSGEGAVRCMRQALATVHAADRLHQHPRHLDAGRRLQGDRRDPRACSATTCRTSPRPSR